MAAISSSSSSTFTSSPSVSSTAPAGVERPLVTDWSYVSEIAISILGYEQPPLTFKISQGMGIRRFFDDTWNVFKQFFTSPSDSKFGNSFFVENEGYLVHPQWLPLTLSNIPFHPSYSKIILSNESKVYFIPGRSLILSPIKIPKDLSLQTWILNPEKIEMCFLEDKNPSRFKAISNIQSLFLQIHTLSSIGQTAFVKHICKLESILELDSYRTKEIEPSNTDKKPPKNKLLEMVNTTFCLMTSYLNLKELFRLNLICPFISNSNFLAQSISNRCVRNLNGVRTPSWEFLYEIFNIRRSRGFREKILFHKDFNTEFAEDGNKMQEALSKEDWKTLYTYAIKLQTLLHPDESSLKFQHSLDSSAEVDWKNECSKLFNGKLITDESIWETIYEYIKIPSGNSCISFTIFSFSIEINILEINTLVELYEKIEEKLGISFFLIHNNGHLLDSFTRQVQISTLFPCGTSSGVQINKPSADWRNCIIPEK